MAATTRTGGCRVKGSRLSAHSSKTSRRKQFSPPPPTHCTALLSSVWPSTTAPVEDVAHCDKNSSQVRSSSSVGLYGLRMLYLVEGITGRREGLQEGEREGAQ